jgi:CelD/BcsL family acetyltransferase involved in cellulose biosynthesis
LPPPEIEIKQAKYGLAFRLGEMYLFKYKIQSAELVSHFIECPVSLADALAFDPEAHGAACTIARSVVLEEPMPELQRSGGRLVYRLGQYRRHFVDLLGQSYDEYQATFSTKSRSTSQRKVRKFETRSGGSIDWATFRTPDEVDAFFAEALPLSEKTYQHRLMDSGLPTDPAFREHARVLAAANQFRGWLLRQDKKAIAYTYSPAIGRTLLYEFVGFDAAHGDQSPGTVLQVLVLQQLMREREFAFFDFTEGEGPHKELFGSGHRLCADVLITPDTWKYRRILGAHRRFASMIRASVALSARLGIKAKLKRLIRRAA